MKYTASGLSVSQNSERLITVYVPLLSRLGRVEADQSATAWLLAAISIEIERNPMILAMRH